MSTDLFRKGNGIGSILQQDTAVRPLESSHDSVGADGAGSSDTSEGVCVVDINGHVVSVNAAAEELLGFSSAELLGKAIHDVIVHPPDGGGNQMAAECCRLHSVLKTRVAAAGFQEIFKRRDGTLIDVICSAVPLTELGEPVGMSLVFNDITRFEQTRTLLRESEDRFAAFMENLPGLAWIKDEEGQYVFANGAVNRSFAKKSEEMFGQTDFDVFPEETAAAFMLSDRKAAEEGKLQTVETFEKNGNVHYWIVNKFRIPQPHGSRMVGGIAIDITDQRHAQEHQDFLFSISDKLRVGRNAEELLADIASSLGKYLGLHRCLFNEIDLENDIETIHLDYSRSDGSIAGRHKISAYSPVSSESMIGGQTVVNYDSQTDPRTADLFETTYGPNKEISYITVPMLRNGTWVASLWCSDDKPRTWTAQEISLVENIAERTWSAVERLRTEEILRRNEEMFSTLVEAAPFGVYFIDSNFRLISINSGARKVFEGIDPLLGRDFAEILRIIWNEPFASSAIEKFRNTLRTGEPYLAPTAASGRANTDVVESYDWQIHRITLADGGHGVVCYFYDLTEQKRLETSVRKTSELNAYRLKLSDRLRQLADPEEIQNEAIRVLGEYLGASRVGYGEFRPERSSVIITRNYTDGVPCLEGVYDYSRFGKHILAELTAGRTILRSDVSTDPNTSEDEKDVLLANQIAASAHIPLVKENELLALLFVHFDKPHVWSEEEAALLEETAERTWAAVERAAAEKREREQARKTLNAQAKFESVFNQSGIFAAIMDVDGRVREINDLAVTSCGYSKDEIIGRHFCETPYWSGSKAVQDQLRSATEAAAGGSVFRAVLPYWNADGTERVVEMSMHPIRDQDGKVILIHPTGADITEQKRSDDALRRSEERYRGIVNQAVAGVAETDLEGRFISVNDRYCELLGRSRKELLQLRLEDVTAASDLEENRRKLEQLIAHGKSFEIEKRYVRPDGSPIWVYNNVYAIQDMNGRTQSLAAIVIDITERRKAEEALRESQERLRLAQTAGKVGVWDWDVEADRTYWSESMWAFYGEEPRDQNPGDDYWTTRLHPSDRSRVKEHLYAALASGAENYRDEFRVDTGAGQVRWLESIANIVRDENGRPTRMYGVNIDITERKISEERIRHSETQLSLVTNSMPALIAYIDRQFRYQFVNERYHEWFGLPTNEIVGKKMREVLGGRAFAVIKPLIAATLAGEPTSVQTRVSYKRAGDRFVQISYIPDVADDGTVRGLYSLVSDLTEWKRSEEMLRSSEQRVAMLMESVSDYAILSTDAHGKIETWNVGAENIFGYSAEEAIGRPVEDLFPADDVSNGAHRAEMHSARLLGRAADERWLVRKDGTRFFASGVMMPLRIGDEINGYVKIVSDLTDKKRRAESLQLAHDELELRVRDRTRDLADVNDALRREIEERERSEAVKIGLLHRIVSAQETERQRIARDIHDQLGQRLTALRLKLAALRNSCHGDDELRSRVERLQEIAQLLDSEVSFLASELRPNTLDDLGLEEALRAHAGDWARHHEVELDFHSNGLSGKRLDRDTEIQLYRIAQEALNNVAKHSSAAKVNVLIEKAADSIVLIIEDDGVGFSQAGRSKRKAVGGLGLVGMNERASLIGAEVEIESVVGKGTTVFVRLPHARTEVKNGG